MQINYEEFMSLQVETKSFTCSTRQVDKTGNFYHITQQCYNRNRYYTISSARYRDYLFKKLCEKYKIIPLCNVVMPSHTHDLVYTDDFKKIEKIMQILNINVSKFIRKERIQNGKTKMTNVFDDYPSYARIETLNHLFFLFKYFFDNPFYLEKECSVVPYSCFEEWVKGYVKHYIPKVYQKLFGKTIEEITELCKKLSSEEFQKLSVKLYGNVKHI